MGGSWRRARDVGVVLLYHLCDRAAGSSNPRRPGSNGRTGMPFVCRIYAVVTVEKRCPSSEWSTAHFGATPLCAAPKPPPSVSSLPLQSICPSQMKAYSDIMPTAQRVASIKFHTSHCSCRAVQSYVRLHCNIHAMFGYDERSELSEHVGFLEAALLQICESNSASSLPACRVELLPMQVARVYKY